MRLPQLKESHIASIYFGGGTPTKLSPRDYEILLNAIYHFEISIASDCEITIEANPEDVSYSLMQQLRSVGINRLSLGVQSLVDEDLLILGRTHNVNRAREAIFQAVEAGFENISIDLMYELPSQGLKEWQRSLKVLADLPITHLSLYNLTFEPNTIFFKERKKLQAALKSEEHLSMLESAVQAFEEIGLIRYEISAFAKPGFASRHNTGYWTGRPFLGFGPSAFSYWEGSRFSNVSHYKKYLQCLERDELPVGFQETLIFPNNLKELLAVGLRVVEGVDLPENLPEEIGKVLLQLQGQQLIVWEGRRVKLTPKGQLFYDSVAVEIVGTCN